MTRAAYATKIPVFPGPARRADSEPSPQITRCSRKAPIVGKKVNLRLRPTVTPISNRCLVPPPDSDTHTPPADFPQPPLTDLPPPLLATDIQTVSTGSVVAALAELNLEALTEDLLKVLHHQE